MIETFGQRFLDLSSHRGALCVGIDPHAALLEKWGLPQTVAGLRDFSRICVEAMRDTVAVVKPQVAFFEAYGSAGFAVLEETIAELRSAGVLVISDAKRGDIGSTMAGYAHAWLSPGSPLESDAVTVSPFLGFDSLKPVFEQAEQYGKGAIVLAATSNPEASTVQAAHILNSSSDISISDDLCHRVAEANAATMTRTGMKAGNLGVVIGATVSHPPVLDQIGGVILMPGVGAQGANMADVRRIAGQSAHLASPNVSRAVLSLGPDVERMRSGILNFQRDMLK